MLLLSSPEFTAMATKSGALRHERIVVIQYEEAKMTALTVLGGIVGIGFLMFLNYTFNGYALSVLWGWFVVPTFGTPDLDVVPAIGIAMVVSYLTYQTHDCKKEETTFGETIAKGTVINILKSSFALFLGWIVHLFM